MHGATRFEGWRQSRWGGAVPVVALLAAVCGGAEPALPAWDDFSGVQEWIQQNLPEQFGDLLEPPTPQQLAAFWETVEATLNSQSLEDYAWILPWARLAVRYLQATPEGVPYADWLQQRLDYFEVASYAVAKLPAAGGPRKAAARSQRLVVPPKPKWSAVAPRIVISRLACVRNEQTWQRKLSARPLPANAALLVLRLKSVFASEGVPPPWVWLAEVESSFNPLARNPVGAAGLYQLMPATAQRFGLSLRPEDERLQPDKSARGAAQCLKTLYGRFHSWPLTLAAYNAGSARVERALRQTGGVTFEAIAGDLPLETQMYVPKALATVALRERVDPAKIPAPR